MSEPVILIDTLNLVFRQHFTHSNLQVDGKHTGVLYGVLKSILDLRNNVSSKILMCWDHGIPIPGAARPRNWREDVVPAYKATRKKNTDDHRIVVAQLYELSKIIETLGYTNVAVMGLEADDIIGILSQQFNSVLVFSTDKDFYQLLNGDNVQVLVPQKEKGLFKYIKQSDVEKEFGIGVGRWAEYLALGGDSSDNIKPMRGMGPKTAIKLILDGLDLRRKYMYESLTSQQKEKFTPEIWKSIMNSYSAAQIPTSWEDPRIQACCSPNSKLSRNASQEWPSGKARAESFRKFEQFLGDHNMVSLLQQRHRFFDAPEPTLKREPTQCLTKHPNTSTVRRSLI